MRCQHCGHLTPSQATRSVAVDHPARPVAAPCTISGCFYHALEAEIDRLRDLLRAAGIEGWQDKRGT
jgi:hypothetical protein